MLHEQHGQESVVIRYYTRYHRCKHHFVKLSLVNSEDGADFAVLFTLREKGKIPIPVNEKSKGWGLPVPDFYLSLACLCKAFVFSITEAAVFKPAFSASSTH